MDMLTNVDTVDRAIKFVNDNSNNNDDKKTTTEPTTTTIDKGVLIVKY
jgi:hypothetical protein